jgi:translocator protein
LGIISGYSNNVKGNFPKLISSLAVCLGVGFLGSAYTVSEIPTWYITLNKPVFAPPNYVFAPIWTVLYILMGVSLYLLWITKSKRKDVAMNIFLAQLVLNFFWSVIFFGLHNPQIAFVEIVALWIFIFLTIRQSIVVSKTSAFLLYPYLAWVSIALILNLSIVILN